MQYLNCPYCWGSGHIGDCENVVPEDLRERIEKMDREIESLEREAVFLSTKLVCASSPKECDFQGDHICDDCDKGRWNFHYWRNLAREFVSKYDTGNPAEEENE